MKQRCSHVDADPQGSRAEDLTSRAHILVWVWVEDRSRNIEKELGEGVEERVGSIQRMIIRIIKIVKLTLYTFINIVWAWVEDRSKNIRKN